MARGLLDSLGLFLLPFMAYGIFLAVSHRYPFALEAWSRGPVAKLVASGLALVVAGIVLTGFFGPRHRGAYTPAHMDRGVLVPGRME